MPSRVSPLGVPATTLAQRRAAFGPLAACPCRLPWPLSLPRRRCSVAGAAPRVGDQQLDVAVVGGALAAGVGCAGPAAGLGVVVGEGAADRGEVGGVEGRGVGAGRRGGRLAGVVDDRAEDRERAVVVVEELQQARLLRPVGLGGDLDAPEAVAVAGRDTESRR